MDIEALIISYRRYLQASIQFREIGAFGGVAKDIFAKQIAEHQANEATYIQEQLSKRSDELQALKAISHK